MTDEINLFCLLDDPMRPRAGTNHIQPKTSVKAEKLHRIGLLRTLLAQI